MRVYIVTARGPHAEKAAGGIFHLDREEAEETARLLSKTNAPAVFKVWPMILEHHMSPLIEFYLGYARDLSGHRTIGHMMAFSDHQLESYHDYIQWVFPLPEPSRFNPTAPLLTEDDINCFLIYPSPRGAMKAMLNRMTRFYLANDHWVKPRDHNFLRITRILRSVRLCLGSEGHVLANQFYDDIRERWGDTLTEGAGDSIEYWRQALWWGRAEKETQEDQAETLPESDDSGGNT